MELTVLDRVMLLSCLPKEGDITAIRIIQKLREDLSFSEDEHKLLSFTNKNDTLTWNPEGNVVKDVPIGTKAKTFISEVLDKLNKEKKLTLEYLKLYDLFVEEAS